MGKLKTVLVVFLVVALFTVISIKSEIFSKENVIAESEINNEIQINDSLDQPNTDWSIHKDKIKVKGIFLTGNSLGYNARFNKLLNLVKETEVNTMVIDVKDDLGVLTYKSDSKLANSIGANKIVKISNREVFKEKMKKLLDNGVYPIARIVTFKDKVAGKSRPDLTIKTQNGNVWRDNKGNAWLNPYNKEAWEYPIELAEEAALLGFKEIQFDYVRFPTDGNRSIIDYGEIGQEKTKAQAISSFLKYARKRIEKKGAYVSADVFGDIINVKKDSGIGQNLETLGESVDILCPMVYPSHYALGSYGVRYPDSKPYAIVNEAMERAINRLESVDKEKRAIIRPWLQDFSAPWLKRDYGSHYTPYGPKQIRAQIQATYDAGLEEWIFWSASNRYTESAFLKEDSLKNE